MEHRNFGYKYIFIAHARKVLISHYTSLMHRIPKLKQKNLTSKFLNVLQAFGAKLFSEVLMTEYLSSSTLLQTLNSYNS